MCPGLSLETRVFLLPLKAQWKLRNLELRLLVPVPMVISSHSPVVPEKWQYLQVTVSSLMPQMLEQKYLNLVLRSYLAVMCPARCLPSQAA